LRFGRGGGDRKDKLLNKACALNALQPLPLSNWNKRNRRQAEPALGADRPTPTIQLQSAGDICFRPSRQPSWISSIRAIGNAKPHCLGRGHAYGGPKIGTPLTAQSHQWTASVQVLVFTRGRKSDGVGSVPVELGRMSHIVKVTIRPSSGNTSRFCPPKPRAIQTYSVESGNLSNHHLKPNLNPSLDSGSAGVWK
jgi:hypothetical protein